MRSSAVAGFALSLLASTGAQAEMNARPGLRAGGTVPVSPSAQIRLDRPVAPSGRPTGGEVAEGIAPGALMDLAREAGFAGAQLSAEKDGKTVYVKGSVEGVSCELVAFECEAGLCKAITCWGNFGKQDEVTLEFMNAFNLKYVGKLVRDGEGEVSLLLTYRFYGGVRRAHVTHSAQTFTRQVKLAAEFKPD